MKTGGEFKVRPLSDFSETETADDWLSVYSETKTVGELLGLLHEGDAYVEDVRVLEVYLFYAKRQDGPIIVLQKARSMLYHHILKQLIGLIDQNTPRLNLLDSVCKDKSQRLKKLFEFFKVPSSFPVQQPFQNDVYEFIDWWGKALMYAAGTSGGGVPKDHWAQFMDVLVASLESENGERYDKFARELLRKGCDPVRNSFMPVLQKRLRYAMLEADDSRNYPSVKGLCEKELCEFGIGRGGFARREALLLLDLTGNNLY
jgi:hypothetical protein